MVISFVLPILLSAPPGCANLAQAEPQFRIIYGTMFRLSSGVVVSDKPEDHSDGVEPRGRTDRRVRADAQRNLDALLHSAKAVFATSGVDAPVREIAERPASASAPFIGTFRSAPTSSQPSSVAKSTPARTPRRSWLPSTSPSKRWRVGCSDTPPLLQPNAGSPRPCIRETRPSSPCARTSSSESDPPFGRFSSPRQPPARSAPMSMPRIFWARSRACACPPTMTATRGAWSLSSSTGYAMARTPAHRADRAAGPDRSCRLRWAQ